jgi:excisionase family DNA binding protein
MKTDDEIMSADEPYWDVHAAARFLNVSESWIYQKCGQGKLPHRKFGGLLRFKPSEVRAYAEDASAAPAMLFSMGKRRT